MFIFGFKIIFVFLFHIHIWSQKYYRVTCAVPWIDSLVSQEDEKEFSRLISLISLTIFSSSKGSETVQTVQISFQKPSSFNQPLYMKKKGKVKLFKQITFSFEFCRFSFDVEFQLLILLVPTWASSSPECDFNKLTKAQNLVRTIFFSSVSWLYLDTPD